MATVEERVTALESKLNYLSDSFIVHGVMQARTERNLAEMAETQSDVWKALRSLTDNQAKIQSALQNLADDRANIHAALQNLADDRASIHAALQHLIATIDSFISSQTKEW
jgi:hypothetical protein